jgi:hypothetical protein
MPVPLQDLYPDDFAHCYGCGRLNAHGLHVKTECERKVIVEVTLSAQDVECAKGRVVAVRAPASMRGTGA